MWDTDLQFEWDEEKAKTNCKKHRVSFELAKLVFNDSQQLTDFDRTVGAEDGYQTFGQVGHVVLVVIYCYRKGKDAKEIIRLISARKAKEYESKQYQSQTHC